ncbi:MAG TPA: cobalamin B12-binding domain-containing protein [Gaiellaceae bacterium]|nr:cobalamin B12-binding domain-containing protein [Gaiellaceae bacterium]
MNERLRIGEVARRSGVSPELLRAWERRYGLLRPARTAGGFRLYGEDDLRRVELMRDHLAQGVAAAQAARLALAEPDGPRTATERRPAALLARLEQFDEPGANEVLDRLLADVSLEAVLRDAVLPTLAALGERWERGELTIAQEHFASSLLRGRLLGLARGWGAGIGPRALLACAPGERHELPLIAFGLALRNRGWRITYLGADTPLATLAETAAELDPAVVVLSATLPWSLDAAEEGLATLARDRPLLLAGPGADVAVAARVGAELLRDGPVDAAARVAATATPPGAAGPRRARDGG